MAEHKVFDDTAVLTFFFCAFCLFPFIYYPHLSFQKTENKSQIVLAMECLIHILLVI